MTLKEEIIDKLDRNNIYYVDFITEMSRFDKNYVVFDYLYDQILNNDAIQVYLNRGYAEMAAKFKTRTLQKAIV